MGSSKSLTFTQVTLPTTHTMKSYWVILIGIVLLNEVSSLPNREKRQEDLVTSSADRTPLDKNTKDQSKIVSHIKELINNVVAENDDEVKVGDLQKPLEFYDTVIRAETTTTTTTTTTTMTTTTTTTTTRRTTTTTRRTSTTTTVAPPQDQGILSRIVNGIGNLFNGGPLGNPLFGSIPLTGRKKRDTFDVRENLYNLRNKLIRTGRNDDETTMIREAVDDAIDKIIEDGIDERDTDIEAIKEQIFLEVASRLEESKFTSQNEIIKEVVAGGEAGSVIPTRIIGEPVLAESVSSTTISTSTTEDNRPVKEATLYNFIADQGPGAIGVGFASLTYAAMASLPYWLPALAAGKKRKRRDTATTVKEFSKQSIERFSTKFH